jgi:cob(I)alamin adenosyltransferase
MVRLSKIYTKTGDDGTTGLASGERVPKDHLRVECYGTVDEANSAVGVAVGFCKPGKDHGIGDVLRSTQHDLFDAGADLATPMPKTEKSGQALRLTPGQTLRLENIIDRYNKHLAPLKSFVLPGGSDLAGALHVARTVVRRAERLAVTLMRKEPRGTNPEAIKYLNRLSDLLFVLSRVANENGKKDVLWVPGSNRSK